MDKQQKKLSVIITTYNRSIAILRRAIESIAAQDYGNIEIFVVDDNQNDSEYCRPIKEYCGGLENVFYIKQEGNKGACAARNLGIRLSKGDFIGFLDDDDAWEPTKASQQIQSFRTENIGMVFCKGWLVDENHRIIREYYNAKNFKERVSHEDLIRQDCIGSTSQAVIRRECFERCGYFNEFLPARQDYEMWLRISQHFDIVGVDQYLFRYCLHQSGQITKDSGRSLQGYKMVYALYKKDFKKNKAGRRNILLHIIKAAKKNKNYFDRLKYGLIYAWVYPIIILKLPYSMLLKLRKPM